MSKASCPYVFRIDANQRHCAPIDYPSFENSCLAMAEQSSLLLADQATFCLSGSFRYCQRYQTGAAEEILLQSADDENKHDVNRAVPELRSGNFTNQEQGAWQRKANVSRDRPGQQSDGVTATATLDEVMTDDLLLVEEESATTLPWPGIAGRWYSWLAAGLLFFAVIAVGGVFAAYTGWQLALDQLATARAGQVNTLASGAVQQVQPLYVVMTVTPEAVVERVNPTAEGAVAPRTGLEAKAEGAAAIEQNSYPAAVTATAVVLVPLPTATVGEANAVAQTNPPALVATEQPANIQLPPAASTPTPVPIINVQVAVPTRRPTPEFDIPTSTPDAAIEPTATATATAVPIVGTPVIVFAADESTIPPGECTHVRWHVENVRAVYYENQAAFGDGSKEECLRDEADSYALTVIFGDGQTKIYTTTVAILWPTATPSITPSFTPEILPTETWTPVPPPATPTPAIVYGTTFSINGDNPYRCQAGSQCNIGVLATNVGDSLDTLAIEIVAAGEWQALLCSQIGTCSGQRLVIANVGPGNTLFATLQLTVPADSTGQTTTYALRSVSDGSNGAVTSQVIELTIESSE